MSIISIINNVSNYIIPPSASLPLCAYLSISLSLSLSMSLSTINQHGAHMAPSHVQPLMIARMLMVMMVI